MTILALSTPQEVTFNQWLIDIVTTEQICDCWFHMGETLRQIDARLPDGKPVRIQKDHTGYHVAIGAIGMCPDPVRADEVERMLQAASLQPVGR